MDLPKKAKLVSIDRKEANKAVPIIATFQNANLNEELSSRAVCKRVQSSSGNKYALIATDSNVYKSDISNLDNDYQDTYIAIRNKRTNEMKLIQVDQASFKHVLYDDTRSSFEKNVLDSQKILAKDFAGKKGAIAFERSQRTKVNSLILEDTVDKMLSTMTTDRFFENDIFEQSIEESDKFRNYIFPRIADSDGKSVREIFTTTNLMGDEIMEHLSEIAIDVLNTEANKLPFTNKYLKNVTILIQNSKQPDSEDNLKKIAMLIYAESLISLINIRKKFVNSLDIMKFSKQLSEDIMKKFFPSGSKQASNFTRQKSIVFYVLLTLLLSDSLQVNLNDILDSVNLSKKELLKFASVMGCKTKGDTLYIDKISNLDKDSSFQIPLMKPKKDKRK